MTKICENCNMEYPLCVCGEENYENRCIAKINYNESCNNCSNNNTCKYIDYDDSYLEQNKGLIRGGKDNV